MGLDSYLTKKTYIGANYEHRNVKGKINITIEGKPVKIDFSKISYIEEQVGYWRKANAIHKWFVENCQGGVDDCGQYSVNHEQLKELHSICQKVLKTKGNKKLAKELLDTQDGFFFGGTDMDEYYYLDIEYTADMIFKALLTSEQYSEFYYQASW